MNEQNQWMDEQERMKEMESRLSIRAYQQRASRWEEEWMRLQEGREVEDILKVIRHDYLSYSRSNLESPQQKYANKIMSY